MKLICSSCHVPKDPNEFVGIYKKGISKCWGCKEKSNDKYKIRHKEKCRQYRADKKEFIKEISRRYHKHIKDTFFEMYGNRCVCCGETNIEFLTIEHKLGQRGVKKKESSFRAYISATKEYQPDTYEVLCMNCNHAKGKLGYCPHQMSYT